MGTRRMGKVWYLRIGARFDLPRVFGEFWDGLCDFDYRSKMVNWSAWN